MMAVVTQDSTSMIAMDINRVAMDINMEEMAITTMAITIKEDIDSTTTTERITTMDNIATTLRRKRITARCNATHVRKWDTTPMSAQRRK